MSWYIDDEKEEEEREPWDTEDMEDFEDEMMMLEGYHQQDIIDSYRRERL